MDEDERRLLMIKVIWSQREDLKRRFLAVSFNRITVLDRIGYGMWGVTTVAIFICILFFDKWHILLYLVPLASLIPWAYFGFGVWFYERYKKRGDEEYQAIKRELEALSNASN